MFEDPSTTSTEVVANDLAGASHLVVIADETLESDRATAVDLVGGDTDLCTEAVSEAVCEPCGTVPVDAGGVDALEEDVCGFWVFCDNGVCVF